MRRIVLTFAAVILLTANVYADLGEIMIKRPIYLLGGSSGGAATSSYGADLSGGEERKYGANLVQRGKKNKIVFNSHLECRENVKKCRTTVTLQVYENGKYTTDVTSALTEYSSTTTWKKDYYVESGKCYRARVKFETFNKNDKLIETKYMVTNTIEAP